MSLVSDWELPHWVESAPSDYEPHFPPRDLDVAGLVNAEPEARPVPATLSALNDAGEVEFLRNVPLWVWPGVPLGLRMPGHPAGDFRVYGILAEAVAEADNDALKGASFVAAAWPYSRGWFDHDRFKRPFNDSQAALAQAAAERVKQSDD